MKRACGTTRKDLQLVQKEDAKAPFYFAAQRCLPGGQISNSSPAVAAAKGGGNPSAGAAKTSPSTATPPSACSDGRPRSSRNLRERKAAAKCLPGLARQCPGRAASSRSPSSSGSSRGGGASWDAAAPGSRGGPEPFTPGQHAVPPPTPPSQRAPGRPLRPRAASPASLRPWGFASCRAMGTLHTSKPMPRSAQRRGTQPSVPRSSPGISGHGPGARGRGRRAARLARSSCRAGAGSGSRGFTRSAARVAWSRGGSWPGFPRCCHCTPARPWEATVGWAPPEAPSPELLLQTEGARLQGAGDGDRWGHLGPSLPPPAPASPPSSPRSLARARSGSGSGSGSRAESVTAAQSGASLTKKARSHGSRRGR